jgi:spore photoproduct lyase
MSRAAFQIARVIVEREARALPRTEGIWQSFPSAEVIQVERIASVPPDQWRAGDLAIAHFRGRFLKRCPGTRGYICCGYRVLNIQTGCDLGCTYCVLQGYLRGPTYVVYANLEDALQEVEKELRAHPDRFFRIGTGELTDSLVLEDATGFGKELAGFFARAENAVLELKTKTDRIGHLLDVDPRGRVVLSWSVNPESVISQEEGKAVSLERRLRAAQLAELAGYRIGFHFDPLIHHPGWRRAYQEVVEAIFSYVSPSSIAWISLGALRYPPALDRILRERHPESRLRFGPLLPGMDGKLRYFRPVRVNMFRHVYECIRGASREVFVYLCMENDTVWREAFGWSPGSMRRLSQLLDERARAGLR